MKWELGETWITSIPFHIPCKEKTNMRLYGFFKNSFIFIFFLLSAHKRAHVDCTHHSERVKARGQFTGVSSLLPPEFWGLNSGIQATRTCPH